MRLDKYLKVSRLIKRRTVANEACDNGRVTANGRGVKASYEVKPGDVLELECELTTRRGPVGFGTATAKVNGKTACKAELTFALTDRPNASC